MTPRLITAIATPFTNDNKIDFVSLQKLLEVQINGKVDGIVVGGSTGGGQTLAKDEFTEILKFCKEIAGNRLSIVASCGGAGTSGILEYLDASQKNGADYILASSPCYTKPQQSGLYNHFKTLNDNSSIPIILYDIISRTGVEIKNDTIINIAKDCKNVVGLKDSSGNLARICSLRQKLSQNGLEAFSLLSGEDDTQIGFNAMGGVGVISVISNFAPELCHKIQYACADNDYKSALGLQNSIASLTALAYIETNPVPLQYILHLMGIFATDIVRQPLAQLSESSKDIIKRGLKEIKLI